MSMPSRTGIVPKSWGHEEIIISNELYCTKYLVFTEKGNKCSMHFHKNKDETWYCFQGKFLLSFINTVNGTIRQEVLSRKQTRRVWPGEIHQIEALEDNSILLETSTLDVNTDNYKVWR